MRGLLGPGQIVALLYRLGRDSQTGGLAILDGPRAHELYLRRGYLTSARVEGHWAPLGELLRERGEIDDEQLRRSLAEVARGGVLAGRALCRQGAVSEAVLDEALRRQTELRLARLCLVTRGEYRFDPAAPAPPAHRSGRPFALTRWARRHLEAQLDARALAAALGGARLALRKDLAPEAGDCDDADLRILAALAVPRRLDEVERSARVPRYRLLAFVGFLRGVGALGAPDDAEAEARRLLGVDAGADPRAIRRAYRELARRWHPDLNPELGDDERRELHARLTRLNEAYRSLSRC